jgi:hypothetical protein
VHRGARTMTGFEKQSMLGWMNRQHRKETDHKKTTRKKIHGPLSVLKCNGLPRE